MTPDSKFAGIAEEPWRFDFFAVLRRLERTHPGSPAHRRQPPHSARNTRGSARIPYMDFPASTLSKFEPLEPGGARILTSSFSAFSVRRARCRCRRPRRPMAGTWRGTTLFRVSSTCSIIASCNCFSAPGRMRGRSRSMTGRATIVSSTYIGALIGLGSPPFRDLDSVPDPAKLGFAGLLGAQAKSASRLRSFIAGYFDVKVGDRRIRRLMACVSTRRTARGSAIRGARRRYAGRGQHFQRAGQDPHPHLCAGHERLSPLSSRTGISASRSPTACSSISATNSTGRSSSRFRPESVEPVRLGRAGALGWTSWMAPELGGGGRVSPRCALSSGGADAEKARQSSARQQKSGSRPWLTSAWRRSRES